MAELEGQLSMLSVQEEEGAFQPEPVEPPAKVVDLEHVPKVAEEAPAVEVNFDDAYVPPPSNPRTPPKADKPKTPLEGRSSDGSSRPANDRLPRLSSEDKPKKGIPTKVPTGSSSKMPSLPAVGNKRGKIPGSGNAPLNVAVAPSNSARSPSRMRGSPKGAEGRDVSPGGGWNMYGVKNEVKPRAGVNVSEVSEEEKAQRRKWAAEARRRKEAKARAEAERMAQQEAYRKQQDAEKLEARRAAIRERIQRQHELAAQLFAENAAAEERARQEAERFLQAKPLYEKINEDFAERSKQEELERQAKYQEEVGKMRNVRPHDIIAGAVVIKPPPKPEAAPEPSRSRSRGRKSPGRFAGSLNRSGGDLADSSGPSPPAAAKPARGGRKAAWEKPAAAPESLVLYSTAGGHNAGGRAPAGPLTERASSPIVLGADQKPTNCPDQSMFWPRRSEPEVEEIDRGSATFVTQQREEPQPKSVPYPGPPAAEEEEQEPELEAPFEPEPQEEEPEPAAEENPEPAAEEQEEEAAPEAEAAEPDAELELEAGPEAAAEREPEE